MDEFWQDFAVNRVYSELSAGKIQEAFSVAENALWIHNNSADLREALAETFAAQTRLLLSQRQYSQSAECIQLALRLYSVIPESILAIEGEVVDRIWEEHTLAGRIAASREMDATGKKAILTSLGLWPTPHL